MKQILLILFPLLLFAQTYQLTGPNQNVAQNVAAKILTKAYGRAHLKINIIFLPPEQALKSSSSGESDGEVARIKNISKLYPSLHIVPVPLVNIEAFAFAKDQNIKIIKWDDLKAYNFTIVKGAKFIEKGTKGLKKEYAKTFLEAFEKLENDKTEVIVIPKKAAISFMLKKKYFDIKVVSPSLQRLELYHFVHEKNQHLIPILTPILQKMKDSGEIDYINFAYLQSLTN